MATFNGFTIVTMPVLPTAPKSIEWGKSNKVGLTDSPFTGQQQIQDWNNSWPEISLSYAAIPELYGPQWDAFMMALRGSANIFQFGNPRILRPLGTGLGSPLVDGSSQTGYTLATKGWTASAQGVLLPGDPIQIGFRMYWVTATANASGAGKVTLSIWPNIRESPLDGTVINLQNTKGVWRLKSNNPKLTTTVGGIYSVTFEAREAI